MKKIIIYWLVISVLVGCGTTLTGYDFDTIASYRTVKSGFKMNLHAKGNVPAGEDLGVGDVTGTISFERTADTIYFQAHSTTLSNLKYKGSPVEITDSTDFTKTFTALFESIGLADCDRNEMEEIEKIIKAATYGPKGTYLEGQTKFIKVEKVEFDRE